MLLILYSRTRLLVMVLCQGMAGHQPGVLQQHLPHLLTAGKVVRPVQHSQLRLALRHTKPGRSVRRGGVSLHMTVLYSTIQCTQCTVDDILG